MTVQYQGVWTLQNAAQLQSTQRWVTDPVFDYTTLLLQADDAANGAQNNTFLDSSSNAFAITRNGNTTQGSFTPFSLQPGAWSNFFGGSGNYVVSNAAVFTNTATTFTIEGWIYPTAAAVSASNIPSVIGDMQPVSTAAYWTFGILASGALSFYWYDGTSRSATSNGTVPLNTWTHIAVSVNANAITLYINGVRQSLTGTTTLTNRTGSNSSVAFAQFSTTGSVFTGYVSNFSVLSGTAKYSTSFTPLLAPLPTGTTNQVLLFAYGNTFADSNTATTAKTFTITGTPSVQAFSPFAPQFQWTPSVIGGSGYFDGSDYLRVDGGSSLAFGSGDFSLEMFVYPTTSGTARKLYDARPSTTAGNYPVLDIDASNNTRFLVDTTTLITGTAVIPANAWTHILVSRVSGNLRLFINGVQDGSTVSNSTNFANGTARPAIGVRGSTLSNDPYIGYISNMRVLIGAGFTSVTVPTAPLTAITNTSLLLNYTNAGIYDGTMKNNLETVGNAQVSTAVVKYGSGSMFFDGTGDWCLAPNHLNFSFGSGDFTVEFWAYDIARSSNGTCWVSKWGSPASLGRSWIIYYDIASTSLSLATSTDGSAGANLVSAVITPSLNVWNHYAVTRANNTYRIFLNGNLLASATSSAALFTADEPLCIGANYEDVQGGVSNYNTRGYIDDLRITTGIARYTQNFIPPSVALPRQ